MFSFFRIIIIFHLIIDILFIMYHLYMFLREDQCKLSLQVEHEIFSEQQSLHTFLV